MQRDIYLWNSKRRSDLEEQVQMVNGPRGSSIPFFLNEKGFIPAQAPDRTRWHHARSIIQYDKHIKLFNCKSHPS